MFKGHDYNQSHYRTPRRIEGYYPDHKGDRAVGRTAVIVAICLCVLQLVGWWLEIT